MTRLVAFFMLLLVLSTAGAQTIVITEIYYNPPQSGTDQYEFIELYNPGAVPVDLANWSFTQGVTFTFGSVTINPGDFVLVCEDEAIFEAFFVSVQCLQWTGALSNSGEDIILVDDMSVQIDVVDYDDAAPWPVTADGTGPSLELSNYTLDNNVASNWVVSQTDNGAPPANPGAGLDGTTPFLASPGSLGLTTPVALETFSVD